MEWDSFFGQSLLKEPDEHLLMMTTTTTMEMCLHKYYFNGITDLKRARDETIRHRHKDTNCVHWAKSEIDHAAPEEWIIYVRERSMFLRAGRTTRDFFENVSFHWIRQLIAVSSPDDVFRTGSNFAWGSGGENTWIIVLSVICN